MLVRALRKVSSYAMDDENDKDTTQEILQGLKNVRFTKWLPIHETDTVSAIEKMSVMKVKLVVATATPKTTQGGL